MYIINKVNEIIFLDENKNQMENDDPAVGGGIVFLSLVWVYEALLRPKDKNRSLAVGLLVCMFALP